MPPLPDGIGRNTYCLGLFPASFIRQADPDGVKLWRGRLLKAGLIGGAP
jgi:hypothetical protein